MGAGEGGRGVEGRGAVRYRPKIVGGNTVVKSENQDRVSRWYNKGLMTTGSRASGGRECVRACVCACVCVWGGGGGGGGGRRRRGHSGKGETGGEGVNKNRLTVSDSLMCA